METKNIISSLYNELKKRPEVRALIPMGYVPTLPVLSIRNDELVIVVPFARYKVSGIVDKTMVFPIRYTMDFATPSLQVIGFKDLAYEELYAAVDFNKAAGFFRHEAIKDLDQNSYRELKAKALEGLDKIVDFLIGDYELSEVEDAETKSTLRHIVEPSLKSYYKYIDEDFFNKYIS